MAAILSDFISSLPSFLDLKEFRHYLSRQPFHKIHWTLFIATCLISSCIFWASSNPRGNVSYVDSLFLVIAATTQAGLNTVNLSSLSTFQQSLLFLLMICGNQIVVSAIVVHIRKRAFKKKFKSIEKQEKNGATQSQGTSSSGSSLGRRVTRNGSNDFRLRAPSSAPMPLREPLGNEGEGFKDPDDDSSRGLDLPIPEVVDRNAQFYGLSIKQREHIRCVEYRAIRMLGYLIPGYIVFWQGLGCLVLGSYISSNQSSATRANEPNPWWGGAFFSIAAFSGAGMSPLDLSVIPFQTSGYMLVALGLLMLAGNTAFPIFLRSLLWILLHILPDNKYCQSWRETIQFILRYPRRVYTHLFPEAQTWYLLVVLLILILTDWLAFEFLNYANPAVTVIPLYYRILDGLFQSLAVRSSGFAVVSIYSLRIGTQALYMMMMYISAFPTVITMRNSNVYEERSLGIYAEDKYEKRETESQTSEMAPPFRRTRWYFIKEQAQRQLGHDIWFCVISMILIACIQTTSFEQDPINYSVFNIIFEVVSAYGCVGLSIGLPNEDYSFCGGWHFTAKLILCAVMLRGRHRGLPVAIDKAIQLPGDRDGLMEECDHEIREGLTRTEWTGGGGYP